ncbi:DUF58 domain-containing protein [Paenibacillus ginsengarvi]|uniref:DUF58 domain-containing protein n=1 Tax=Paenibacillus ginsengarvi TaxID=400777 RepID=A0A3B0BER4_9BACL|nr:DUF58 domain-containing protein [Paenibacillus ginsengarvi]RKN71190.1 DUF58 domain-containing protein [Paenibacillus ginsengarvi]
MRRRSGWGNFIVVAVLCAGCYGLAEWRGGYSAFFLFYGTAVMLAAAVVLLGFGTRRLQAERLLSEYRFFAGDDAHVRVYISRSLPVPFGWMIVSDVWTDGTAEYRHSRLLFPGFKRDIRFRYKLNRVARGRYRFVRLEVDAGDFLGLLRKRVTLAAETEFAVYPKPLALHFYAFGGEPDSDHAASVFRLEARLTPLVTSVRDYAPGDPLHRIHWKATARTGSLQTKMSDPAEAQRLAILLDPSHPGYAGGEGAALFEASVRAVAALLEWTVKEGAYASLHAGGDQSLPYARRYDLLDAYELLSGARSSGSVSGADMLLREATGGPGGCAVVFVTAALDERLAHAARTLTAGRRRLTVWLMCLSRETALSEHQRRLIGELENSGGRVVLLRAPKASLADEGGAEDVIA